MPAYFVRIPKYLAPDGKEFDSLAAEQTYEISCLLQDVLTEEQAPADIRAKVIMAIIDRQGEIGAILRQRERKHASPEARKTRKPRTPKTTATQPV